MRALILAIISGVKAASPSLSRLARKYSSKGSSQGKRDGDEERDDNADREDCSTAVRNPINKRPSCSCSSVTVPR